MRRRLESKRLLIVDSVVHRLQHEARRHQSFGARHGHGTDGADRLVPAKPGARRLQRRVGTPGRRRAGIARPPGHGGPAAMRRCGRWVGDLGRPCEHESLRLAGGHLADRDHRRAAAALVAPRRRRGVRLLFFQVAAIPRFARGRLATVATVWLGQPVPPANRRLSQATMSAIKTSRSASRYISWKNLSYTSRSTMGPAARAKAIAAALSTRRSSPATAMKVGTFSKVADARRRAWVART